jgi:hypothetical protein
VPRSPANLRASGSRKTASARSVSPVLYIATQRAVSDIANWACQAHGRRIIQFTRQYVPNPTIWTHVQIRPML